MITLPDSPPTIVMTHDDACLQVRNDPTAMDCIYASMVNDVTNIHQAVARLAERAELLAAAHVALKRLSRGGTVADFEGDERIWFANLARVCEFEWQAREELIIQAGEALAKSE